MYPQRCLNILKNGIQYNAHHTQADEHETLTYQVEREAVASVSSRVVQQIG